MPFLLLLFLTLACFADDWPPLWGWVDSVGKSALLTWAGVALEVGLAALLAYRVRRQLARYPFHREDIIERYGKWRSYHLISQFAVYALSLLVFGWGWFLAYYPPANAPLAQEQAGILASVPGVELLILAPFLVSQILSWACFYDAELALHRTESVFSWLEPLLGPEKGAPRQPAAAMDATGAYWSRRAFVGFHVRLNLALVCIPIGLLILEKGTQRLFPTLGNDSLIGVTPFGLLAALGVFATIPLILRLVLGLQPLAPGPLRERLLAASQRLNFRCNDILLWNTRGHMANAMAVGVLPWLRYVLLSDRLVKNLTPDEVEAVFGHEVGHFKHYHMIYYLSFLMISVFVLGLGASILVEAIWPNPDQSLVLLSQFSHVAMVGGYIFVVFGFLSRRCERQADIYGCRAVSCAQGDCQGHDRSDVRAPSGRGLCATGINTFVAALEKVARLNGISLERPGLLQSWLHSTIARRIRFLKRMRTDPTIEPRFQRTVLLVKCGVLVVLGILLAAVILAAFLLKLHTMTLSV